MGRVVIPNLHHLELFYYVALHGGVSRAARHMPYGIQQPAISKQLLQFEADVGVRLFERQPFRLTAEGRLFFAVAEPFFAALENAYAGVRAGAQPPLRIAAPELVLRDYLPGVIDDMHRRHPALRFDLETGYQAAVERRLLEGAVDFAIVARASPPRAGLAQVPLLELPLALAVPPRSPVRAARDLWSGGPIAHSLIALPAEHGITPVFERGLRQMKVRWPARCTAPSLGVVLDYVAQGRGIGVAVAPPRPFRGARVRLVPLPGFDSVPVVALWRPPGGPLHAALRAVIEAHGEVWRRRQRAAPIPRRNGGH